MIPAVRVNRARASATASLAAPVGGWNARDALGEMDPNDAIYLTNWFPTTTDVMVRKGYSQWETGITGQVETLMAYSGGSTDKLLAAAGTAIYNVTAGGAVGAAVVSSQTNARWQYINVATAGGNFLLAVNGADKMRYYDGTTHSADGATYTVTGINTQTVSHINLFKNRVWLIETGTLNAWYLPTSSIAGAATAFPLQGVAQLGGYIMAMGTWTIDAGYGIDDMAVFVTSKGEIIVYRGTDPANVSTWSLVGIWRLGSPIGRRCLFKYAGDLLLICQDGLLPLSSALQSSRLNPKVALTDKIQYAVSNAITSYGSTYGWQIAYYPKANQVYLNVPVAVGSQQQYVMNSITKSWCNFTGWNANCFEIWKDDLYFGGNGFVGKAWDTFADNSANIEGDAKQAFNYFGNSALNKKFNMIRPVLLSNGSPSILGALNIDFDDSTPTGALSFSGSTQALWDTAIWDQAIWAGGLDPKKNWQGVTGFGYCAAIRLKTAQKGIETHWVSTDIAFERGGIL